MKQILYIMSLALSFLGCIGKAGEVAGKSDVSKTTDTDNEIKLHKLKKLFIVGEFDGDGKRDTIFQHNYSGITNAEIEYSADPFQNEWDTVVKWFHEQEVNVVLTLNKNNQNNLDLGIAQGLYCLINVGDNNSDGIDEFAFVVDYLDYSRVNSCKIYSLCDDTWTQLVKFGIHEDAFDFTTDKMPIFNEIEGYLENKNGKWFYKNYLQEAYDNPEDVGKMLNLKIDKCR